MKILIKKELRDFLIDNNIYSDWVEGFIYFIKKSKLPHNDQVLEKIQNYINNKSQDFIYLTDFYYKTFKNDEFRIKKVHTSVWMYIKYEHELYDIISNSSYVYDIFTSIGVCDKWKDNTMKRIQHFIANNEMGVCISLMDYIKRYSDDKDPLATLGCSFNWSESTEGETYWVGVHKNIRTTINK